MNCSLERRTHLLIKLSLLKKETNMLVGGYAAHEFEECAIKLSTLMSAGPNEQKPDKWTDVMFMGLPSTVTVEEEFHSFVDRVNNLHVKFQGVKND